MPIYCYECDACGAVSEEFHFASRPPASLACAACGRTARRSYAAEVGAIVQSADRANSAGRAGRAGCPRIAACGEIRSVAAGVMPHQAVAAQRAADARGLDSVRFDRATGDAIFRDRPSRLRALKAMGLHDRDEVRG